MASAAVPGLRRILARRGRCKVCFGTLTVLPGWCVPGASYSLVARQQALDQLAQGCAVEQTAPHCRDPDCVADPSTIRRTTDATKAGRDHHPLAYSLWAAGGGVRGGQVIGKTDDLCMSVAEDPVHVHDLQATLLHLGGLRSHETHVPPPGAATSA